MAPVKVGINGFGRIGRNLFRAAHESGADLDIVAVNDITDVRDPRPPPEVRLDPRPLPGRGARGRRRDRGRRATRSRCWPSATPPQLPWGDLGVEVVIESTGLFTKREDASKHLDAGARKVIISAPATEPDVTVALGVNFDSDYDPESHHIISNASCTTNCLAPVAKVLQRHGRHRARPDDDDPCVHGRPAPPGHAAQGPAPRARGGAQPDPDVDRGREGDRAGAARAGGQAERVRGACAGCDRLGGRPGLHRLARDLGRRDQRGGEGSRRRPARRDPLLHRGPDRLDRHRPGPALVDLRRRADDGHGGHNGQDRRLVRQRVGLLEPRASSSPPRCSSASRPPLDESWPTSACATRRPPAGASSSGRT